MGLFGFLKKKSYKDELLESRLRVTTELKEAEKNFLQHKIDKSTFDAVSRDRNSDLIRIDAEIDLQKHKDLPKEDVASAQKVSADKRRIILGLLNEKQKKVYELKISENSYLKRRISEEVYQNISSEIRKEIISIDSQVKAILESEEIFRLKEELKSGGLEIAKQKKLSKERNLVDVMDEMGEDIFEQTAVLETDEIPNENERKKQRGRSGEHQKIVMSENEDNVSEYPVDDQYSENKKIPRRLRIRRS